MSRRPWYRALGWSLAAHLLLVAGLVVFLRRHPPKPEVVAETEISFELALDVPDPKVTIAEAKDTGAAQQAAPTAHKNTRAFAAPNAPPHEASADQAVTPQGLPDASSVDRLWTLRGQPNVALPSVRVAIPPETEQPLLGPALVKPRLTPPLDLHTVQGRGDVKMHLAEDGSIERFDDPPADVRVGLLPGVGPAIGGRFDLTDKVMRAAGMNPYRHEQHRLAEETREERLCRMRDAQVKNEREALYNLNERLQGIWNAPTMTARERRKLLFQLWDECREAVPDAGIESAEMVRATIEAFVRKHLPKNSAQAYLSTELAVLNRSRNSRRRFNPYGSSAAATPDAGAQMM